MEITSLIAPFYQKWTNIWPRPGQGRPDPDNTGQKKRARSRPDRANQTCANHRACAQKRPKARQTQARQSRRRASKNRAKSKPCVQKMPRLCRKIGRKQGNQSKAEAKQTQARSEAETGETGQTNAPVHKNRPPRNQQKWTTDEKKLTVETIKRSDIDRCAGNLQKSWPG